MKVDSAIRDRLEKQLAVVCSFPRVKPFVRASGPGEANWLLQARGDGKVRLIRREGMKTGAIMLKADGLAAELSSRLVKIARAEMLMKLALDMRPDEQSVREGTALAFDVDLLREPGGTGAPEVIPLGTGGGLVLRVGDRIGLRFTNRGSRAADITVLQIDQNYDIIQVYPRNPRR